MKSGTSGVLILILLICIAACDDKEETNPESLFNSVPIVNPIIPVIEETSGIADSKTCPGYFWVQEDNGNPAQLILVGHNGIISKKIPIKGASNRDWEDMCLVLDDLYIADIGDNLQKFKTYTIYQFKEPSISAGSVTEFNKIKFTYEDSSHDAEAFLVDPQTRDIFLITKKEQPSRIYKLTYPYSTTEVNTAKFIGNLNYSGVVSAALSPDNQEIIIKTYNHLYHYSRTSGEAINQTLQKEFTSMAYKLEAQGEAITFAADNSGYYTLSEKGFSSEINLYFYKRK